MTHFRFMSLAVALTAASSLVACNTAPAMPMGATSPNNMATPDQMAKIVVAGADLTGPAEISLQGETSVEFDLARPPSEWSHVTKNWPALSNWHRP